MSAETGTETVGLQSRHVETWRFDQNMFFFSSSSPYQVFDDLQKMLSIATETDQSRSDVGAARFTASPVLQLAVGLCVALATVGAAMYGM